MRGALIDTIVIHSCLSRLWQEGTKSRPGEEPLGIGRRGFKIMESRYKAVRLDNAPSILLKKWRCRDDGAVITNEDDYGRHISLYPEHRVVADFPV